MVGDVVVVNCHGVCVVKLYRLDSHLHELAHKHAVVVLIQVQQLVNAVFLVRLVHLHGNQLLETEPADYGAFFQAGSRVGAHFVALFQTAKFIQVDTLKETLLHDSSVV